MPPSRRPWPPSPQAGTLAELKEARLAHTGDASPLTLANRLIGTLDKADKPTAGKLLGGARGRIAKALAARQETLEAAAEEEMLRTEAVDVTVPTSRTVTGARHPLDVLVDEVTDLFIAMGWAIAEGPEVEHEWFDFDALNFDADHPRPPDAGHLLHRRLQRRGGRGAGGQPCAAHPHIPGPGPSHARSAAPDLRGLPRQGLPLRRARSDPHPPSSTRSRAWPWTRA